MKWEYKIIYSTLTIPLENTLNNFGIMNWELVWVSDSASIWIFKKQILRTNLDYINSEELRDDIKRYSL